MIAHILSDTSAESDNSRIRDALVCWLWRKLARAFKTIAVDELSLRSRMRLVPNWASASHKCGHASWDASQRPANQNFLDGC
jgi:hypothetical protein